MRMSRRLRRLLISITRGSLSGDKAKLNRAFHPRASIVGNEGGELYWGTLEEFAAECEAAAGQAGEPAWQIDGLSFEGDTALVRFRR